MANGDEFLALHDRQPRHQKNARAPLRHADGGGPRITLIRELPTEQQIRCLAALVKGETGRWPTAALKERWRRMTKVGASRLIDAYHRKQSR